METCRRNLILFGVFKIVLGLTISFGLGVYILPILTAETGMDDAAITAPNPPSSEGVNFIATSKVLTVCIGVREQSWLATMLSDWLASCHLALTTGCILPQSLLRQKRAS